MKKFWLLSILVPLFGVATSVRANDDQGALVLTASNATANQLLVYNTSGGLLQTIPTQGQGGVSGNAGGIAVGGGLIAVVNFGSKNVSIFESDGHAFQMTQLIPAVSNPVSVAFGGDHLYILGTTKVESHVIFGSHVNSNPDGVVSLLLADGSAAQVGVVSLVAPNGPAASANGAQSQLILTEKTGDIETVNLLPSGAASGTATLVQNIPANPLAPFGLVTRGNDAYVTIAHSNEITLVRDDKVLTVTNSGTQNAPCWLTLDGVFLYSSNSPSMSISRYAVYGQKIVQDLAVAASLNGDPTDIAAAGGLLAVVDGNGPVSHLSTFSVDEDGNLTLMKAVTISGAINGVAVLNAR